MAKRAISEYFDAGALAALRSLPLRSRRAVTGTLAGIHPSPQHGASTDFAEHRPYTPGDDLRHFDWKVFARTDKLYVKRYHQETSLQLELILDASPSMAFSAEGPDGWRKFDHAVSLAAALSYLALGQQDRVGMTILTPEGETTVRALTGLDHWRALLEAAGAAAPQAVTRAPQRSLERAVARAVAGMGAHNLVVWITDGLDEPDRIEAALGRIRGRRQDAVLVQVLDPAERRFPFDAPAVFHGLEGEGRLAVEPRALRDAYLEQLAAHQRRLRRAARGFAFDHWELETAENLAGPLRSLLARRDAAIRKRAAR